MKKFYFFIVIILASLFLGSGLDAQVPDGFNYQAVARDESTGDPISNATLNVRIAILSSLSPAQVIWEEEHIVNSNEFGLFTILVGDLSASFVTGTAGSFSDIDWTSGSYYLRPSIMQSGGSWQLMTPTRLIAVPFAMLARDVEHKQQISKSGDFIILTDGGSVDLSPYLNPDQTINLNENILSISGSPGSTVDLSAYIDENQKITKDGNIITLDGGGGTVDLGEYVNQFEAEVDTLRKTKGSLVIGPDNANGSILKLRGTEENPVAPLFEVKNRLGQQVFAVYDNGVQIHVDDISLEKGSRGGFVVAGFDKTKAPGDPPQDFLLITPDSVRMFIPETSINPVKAPGGRGGFAIGGFGGDKKASSSLYFNVSGRNEVDVYSDVAQMLWYPQKEAFQAGRINIPHADSVGLNSTAFGYHPMAKGAFSQAFGNRAKATGDNSTAIGNQSEARGQDSYAFGSGALALGSKSFAMGSVGVDTLGNPTGLATLASGENSFALGMGAQATKVGSMAQGLNSLASGDYSLAMGYKSRAIERLTASFGVYANASGKYSLALGYSSDALYYYSVAVGYNAQSSGYYSTSIGYNANASNYYATAIGYRAKASGRDSYAFGSSAEAVGEKSFAIGTVGLDPDGKPNAIPTRATGNYSLAMGMGTQADNFASIAIGVNANANNDYSVAVGNGAVASGEYSTSLGYETSALGNRSIAIGAYYNYTYLRFVFDPITGRFTLQPTTITKHNTANGDYSISLGNGNTTYDGGLALGSNNTASKIGAVAIGHTNYADSAYSLAVGYGNYAQATYGFAMGQGLYARSANSFNVGRYNLLEGTRDEWVETDPLFVVGNGTSSARSNAFTVFKNGNALLNGDLSVETLNVSGTVNTTANLTAGAFLTSNWEIDNLMNKITLENSLRFYYSGSSRFAIDQDGQLYSSGSYDASAGATYRYLVIDDNGMIGTLKSSARYKKNIESINNVEWLYNLNPVTFNYKSDKNNVMQFGLIAEEVEKVYPVFVSYNKDGTPETVRYQDFIAPLIKAVQNQKLSNDLNAQKIAGLESENIKLRDENNELRSRLEQLEIAVGSLMLKEK